MNHKVKELYTAAGVRRCAKCAGDKTVRVPIENSAYHDVIECPSCAGSGYQDKTHTPATAKQLAYLGELLARHAVETRELLEKQTAKAREMTKLVNQHQVDDMALRRLLAIVYCPPPHLYLDDSEMHDARTAPFIDFVRDTPEQINSKMIRRSLDHMQGTTVLKDTPPLE